MTQERGGLSLEQAEDVIDGTEFEHDAGPAFEETRRVEMHQAVSAWVTPVIRTGTAFYNKWWGIGWKIQVPFVSQWYYVLMAIQETRPKLMSRDEMAQVLRMYGQVLIPARLEWLRHTTLWWSWLHARRLRRE
jgi:hypothetical protein